MENESRSFKVGRRTLMIEKDQIFWDTKIDRNSVHTPIEIRYGVAPIQVDMFTLGSNYKIELRNQDKSKITIPFRVYFGLKRKEKVTGFDVVLKHIWEEFFEKRFDDLIDLWEGGESLKIGKFLIDQGSITKESFGTAVTLEFDDIQIEERIDSLVLSSESDSRKYMTIQYLEDWNWPLLYNILEVSIKSWNKN